MGQTQILFIVLSVIIVGIAVAVGITQFGSNAEQANVSACELDCQSIGSKLQLWYRKPASLGGGGNSFLGATMENIGMGTGAVGTTYDNDNGTFTLSDVQAAQVTITCDAKGAGAAGDMTFLVTVDNVQKQ